MCPLNFILSTPKNLDFVLNLIIKKAILLVSVFYMVSGLGPHAGHPTVCFCIVFVYRCRYLPIYVPLHIYGLFLETLFRYFAKKNTFILPFFCKKSVCVPCCAVEEKARMPRIGSYMLIRLFVCVIFICVCFT